MIWKLKQASNFKYHYIQKEKNKSKNLSTWLSIPQWRRLGIDFTSPALRSVTQNWIYFDYRYLILERSYSGMIIHWKVIFSSTRATTFPVFNFKSYFLIFAFLEASTLHAKQVANVQYWRKRRKERISAKASFKIQITFDSLRSPPREIAEQNVFTARFYSEKLWE